MERTRTELQVVWMALVGLLLVGLVRPVYAEEPTLARLSFWAPPERMAEFEAAYEEQVAPILKKYELVESSRQGRVTPDSVFSRLFEFETPAQVGEKSVRVNADPAFREVLQAMGAIFGSAEGPIKNAFETYTTPAGSGRAVKAGAGSRQGLWQSYGVVDGLPGPVVQDAVQDREGNLWFATWYGVCRYDGERVVTFTMDDGLAGNDVRAILQDRQDNLWMGTNGGISRYDGNTFVNFTATDGLSSWQITDIMEDRAEQLWFVAENGVSRYDGERFTYLTTEDGAVLRPEGGRTGCPNIIEDRKGHIWLGTGFRGSKGSRGVYKYDGERLLNFTTQDGLPHNSVHAILEDSKGHIWLGTHKGLSRYDGQGFTNFTTDDGLAHDEIYALAEDKRGILWIGTYQSISRFDGEKFVNFDTNQVNSIIEDREGHMWVATWGDVRRYDGAFFTHFTVEDGLVNNGVMCIMEDRRGHLWFGTWRGVSRYDGEKLATFDGMTGKNVWSILEDRQENVWFSSFNEIGRYDGQELTFFAAKDRLPVNGSWLGIMEDRQGNLWFSTTEGLVRYNGSEFVIFTTRDGLPGNNIKRRIIEDSKGRLVVETDAGTVLYDGSEFIPLTTENGLQIGGSRFEDEAGHLWFSSWDGGVYRYDGERWTHFTIEDGLAYTQIEHIMEDDRGHLWFSSWGGGVYRYDGLVFQTLSQRDGLVHNTTQQTHQDRNGDFWIATEGGITRYRPRRTPPLIRLTGATADRRYGAVEEISLSASQQFMVFEFQGSSKTTHAAQMAYVYRLEGRDNAWQTTRQNRVEFTGLSTGEYLFQVKAVDLDLNYSDEPATVKVTVIPPYAKVALLSGLGIALVGLVLAARYGIRRRKERDQARQELVRERRQRIEVQPHDIEQWTLDDFVEQSLGMRLLFEEVGRRQAESASRVLITGEAGTGKELMARAIHAGSPRSSGNFVAVRCAQLPADVTQLTQRTQALSQMFGHVEGAFAGADRAQEGYLQQAAGGTLFFDEIGLMPLPLQAHLLRVLTQGEVRRVGAEQAECIDIRVLAATSMDVVAQVASGAFHAEWYEYLAAHRLEVPPLRERPEDIALLAQRFAQAMMRKTGQAERPLEAAVVEQLQSYAYPGNVRELKTIIERALIESGGGSFGVEQLHLPS